MKYSVVIGCDTETFEERRIRKTLRTIRTAFKEANINDYEIIMPIMYENFEKLLPITFFVSLQNIDLIMLPITYPKNGKFSKPILYNRGIRGSLGDIIITCDIDILWNKNVIVQVEKLIEEKTLIGADINFLNEGCADMDRIITGDVPENQISNVLKDATKKHWFYGNFHCMLRQHWWECQGYDERMRIWGEDDNDLFLRCKKAGFKLKSLESNSNYHLWHEPRKNKANKKDIERNKSFVNEEQFVKNDIYWGTIGSEGFNLK